MLVLKIIYSLTCLTFICVIYYHTFGFFAITRLTLIILCVCAVAHFITFLTKSFGHLIASLHSGQDFLYHKCVPQWSIFTGATSSFLVKSFSHIDLIHLIIFLFLNFIEELISIFCFPFTRVFHIPF